MSDFILDSSRLGGVQYLTRAFDMQGEFRDVQFHWTQSVSRQDMEGHFLELHFTMAGVDEAL